MKRLTIAFIVLVVMLFIGIIIIMQPNKLVMSTIQDNSLILRAIITLGSALTITGLVGLGVLGFVISSKKEDKRKSLKK